MKNVERVVSHEPDSSLPGFLLYIHPYKRFGSKAKVSKTDRDEDVRRLAYFLWEKAGRPNGSEHHFWAEAAREIEGGANGSRDERMREPRSVAR